MNQGFATGAGKLPHLRNHRSRAASRWLDLRATERPAPTPYALETMACVLALAGVLASILAGFHPRIWQASGSDLKTLYASAACFQQHLDPYNFKNLAAVFQANDVVPPASWYAHAPVYPPFTLAVIAPLTLIPMVGAVYLWIVVSASLLAYAAFLLVRLGADSFHLSRPWRFGLIALFAASPLLSFSLEMCNVSAVVAALCIIAIAAGPDAGSLASACALCLALLLKPHLAIWVVVALFFSRTRKDRALAIRTLSLAAVSVLCVLSWMAIHHQLLPNLVSYRAMVGSEVGAGSMAASNRELIAVAAQITSLGSLLGYWLHGTALHAVSYALLVITALCLAVASRLSPGEDDATRLLHVASWCAFGMIVTYHRAHDATVLLLILPLVVARLRTSWMDPFAWSTILLSLVMGIGPAWETYASIGSHPGLGAISNFLLHRQSAAATSLLVLLLTAETLRAAIKRDTQSDAATSDAAQRHPHQPLRVAA